MKYKKPKSYLFIFLLLFTLFLMPFIVAMILYTKNPLWLHKKTVNKGILISSQVNLHQFKLISDNTNLLAFTNHWFLFYLTTSSCQQVCQKNLHTMRQIIVALGKNSSRAKYGVILTNDKLFPHSVHINKDPKLLVYRVSKPELDKYFALLNMNKTSDAYYLADPLGRIILYYPSDASGEDMYQDLSRLLIISTTG